MLSTKSHFGSSGYRVTGVATVVERIHALVVESFPRASYVARVTNWFGVRTSVTDAGHANPHA